ncbi:putative beta-barrel porin MtrB/PioB [Luteibacter rhizovicinus]|uniref:Putative beta-barrel porin MtrB/PioB n=1 Tax=Luteibacter rhizovicinus TaxID=242606 RepID=A0A4R3YJB0_9GAMM|nr:MtrB/PioB family outer membrane beta-barrel protein [Luteibacter rhizovicinus]TCV92316.1 putative beta-barrel porin MtrB/PioB [Luteibacter rhizovicinus]
MHALEAKVLIFGIGVACASCAFAGDTSGTMRVGDMQFGNALDPRGWTPMLYPADPDGMSYLHAGMLRTPTGLPYRFPPAAADVKPLGKATDWTYSGVVELGFIHVGGGRNAEFFRQYADWKSGFALGLLALDFQNAKTGQYVELRGSRLSGDDQFYRLRAGQYGRYRVEAFYRDMPHTVSTNAYPLWNGVGTSDLTLPSPLIAGASTPGQVAAAHAGSSRRTIGLTRTREGIGIEGTVWRNWIGSASVTNEKRSGTRLWGGSMFFNYPFPDNGGVLETVRPIDFRTTDVNLSVRNVGRIWRFMATYTGSFFRNNQDHLNFESPFRLYNVVGTPQVADIKYGQFSLEPDNDYHNVRLDLSRELKGNGQFTVAAAYGTMRQNDALLPPTTCTGTGGIFIAPPVNYTFNCADWNTTNALSQKNANARIDTGLIDTRLTFRPTPTFGWHANLRWYREDNKTRYLAYNPITGQYGYISENGSQGSIVPGESGIFDPRNPLLHSANVTVRNVPYGYTDTLFELGGDWEVAPKQSLSATYTFDHNQPKYRERKRVDDQRIKLAWVARSVGGATIRASYEYASRTGDHYNYDPYKQFFSESLAGFVDPVTGIAAHTVDDMRKYDLSDRTENKARLILTYPWGDSTTLSATFYGSRDRYDTQIGRQNTSTTGATLQWDWQPTPATTMNVYLGAEGTRLGISNVADNESLIGSNIGQTNPSLGGPLYPYANQWWEFDRERNSNAGLSFSHDFGRVRADVSYNYSGSFGHVGYNYASLAALAYHGPNAAAAAGDSFPDNSYRSNSVDLGLSFRFTNQLGMRLFGRYETGSFTDFHYAGFDNTLDYDHRVYTDKGPQRHYSASLVGAMLNVKL